ARRCAVAWRVKHRPIARLGSWRTALVTATRLAIIPALTTSRTTTIDHGTRALERPRQMPEDPPSGRRDRLPQRPSARRLPRPGRRPAARDREPPAERPCRTP